LHELCQAIIERDVARQLRIIEDVVAGGKDLSQFVQEILRYYRNLLVCKSSGALDLLHLPEDEIRAPPALRAQHYTLTQLIRFVEQFAELNKDFDSQLAQRIALEALLIRLLEDGHRGLDRDRARQVAADVAEGGGAAPSGCAPAQGSPAPASPAKAAPAQKAPPPRPTEAGPAHCAIGHRQLHGAPRSPAEDLPRHWVRIQSEAQKLSLKAAIWLGGAVPVSIEGTTLVLRFPANATKQREVLEKADTRQLVEQALVAATDNLTTFRTELAATEAVQALPAGMTGNEPYYPGVNPEQAKALLEDPQLALVVETFKGKIAEVRERIVAVAAPAED
jgi:DNA polymerase III gamma/tau subunit